MKKISVWDTTLRDGEQAPGFALSGEQKVEVARCLDEIGVDTIEAGFPANYEHDFESVRAVAEVVENAAVAAFSRVNSRDIGIAAAALEKAKKPVILTCASASDEKIASIGWTRQQLFDYSVEAIEHSLKYTSDVMFGVEFAERTDASFLYELLSGVVEAGATRIGIPDTRGAMLPAMFGNLIKGIRENVKGDYSLDVHCHNDLGLAVANSLAGLVAGADGVQVSANSLGERAGNVGLETFLYALRVHGDELGMETGVDYRVIVPNVKKIAEVFGYDIPVTAPVVGENVFASAAGMHLKDISLYFPVDPEEVFGVEVKHYEGPHSGSTSSGEKKVNPKDRD